MKKTDLIIFSLVFFILLSINPAAAGDPPKLVGLAIPEAGTDKGWNEQGKAGLEIVAKKYGFKIELAEALGYGDIKPTLRDMAKKGCELIICHAAGYQTVALEIAKETGVKVITVENHSGVTAGLISDIDTQPQGGSYLAGWLAGKMTRSNIVGIVASGEPPTWNRMSAGFAQGLKASNPKSSLLYSVIGAEAYSDAAGANAILRIKSPSVPMLFSVWETEPHSACCKPARQKKPETAANPGLWTLSAINDR